MRFGKMQMNLLLRSTFTTFATTNKDKDSMAMRFSFFGSIPTVTRNLLLINVLVWLAQYVALLKFNVDLSQYLGLHYWASDDFAPYQLFTYMFLHNPAHYVEGRLAGIDFTHVFFNMFAVYMLGQYLEHVWGGKRYLFYYVFTGLGAGIVQLLVSFIRIKLLESGLPSDVLSAFYSNMNAPVPEVWFDKLQSIYWLANASCIGASGAVFGVLIGFGMLFPNEKLMIIPIPVPVKAKYFVIGYAVLELILGFAALDAVAHFAHLGGLLFGLGLLLYWKHKHQLYDRTL
jgi:membrane associated rhomboid family serine protease